MCGKGEGNIWKEVQKQKEKYDSPEQIHALKVASHLLKYRLILKKVNEAQQQKMPQLDGLRNFNATRQMQSSALLSPPHPPSLHSSVSSLMNLQRIKSSSIIQQGHHQNSFNSANRSETYLRNPLQRVQNMNLSQPTSSPPEALHQKQFLCIHGRF
ncbi:hypothetical protein CARUB_v10027292mg [Capsella rubella]|uniref:Uncharacterized protein n=1 Tax=Capsella rubella TaxID=81985 RepID=R0EXZ1_9BRAS|nr:hypothetical protein CARUB_v10027292mg [Capsella rubella]